MSLILAFSLDPVISSIFHFDHDYVKYLFFNNADLYQYFEGGPVVEDMTLSFSIVILLIYLAIFLAISLFVFQKRDVTG